MAIAAIVFGVGLVWLITTIGLMKLFSRWNDGIPGLLAANIVAFIIVIVIAEGGPGKGSIIHYGDIGGYIIPQLVILAITYWYWHIQRKNAAVETAATSTAKKSWGQRLGTFAVWFLVVPAIAVIGKAVGSENGKRDAVESRTAQLLQERGQKQNRYRALLKQGEAEIKPTLPERVDDKFAWVDVRADDLTMIYGFEVNPKLKITNWTPFEQLVKNLACGNAAMREALPYGVSVVANFLSASPEKQLLKTVTVTSCE